MVISHSETQSVPDPFAREKQAHRNQFYSGNGLAIAIFNYLIGLDEQGRSTGKESSFPCPIPGSSNHTALTTLLDAECIRINLVPSNASSEEKWPVLTLCPEVGAMVISLRLGIGLQAGEHGSFHHLIGELMFRAFSHPIPESRERTKTFLDFASNLAACHRYQWHDSEHENLLTLQYLLTDIHTTTQILALNHPDLDEEQKASFKSSIFINLQPLFKSSLASYPSTTAVIGLISEHVLNGQYVAALTAINGFLTGPSSFIIPAQSSPPAKSTEDEIEEKEENNPPTIHADDAPGIPERDEPKNDASLAKTWNTSQEIDKIVKQCAKTIDPILILGETGTGKSFLAEQIFKASKKTTRDSVGSCCLNSINCSNLTKGIAASELFGHAKGTFTGLNADRNGIIKTSAGGTVFLDEVGDLEPGCRAMLLTFLDSGEFKPVGEDKSGKLSKGVRIICATNKPETELLAERFDFFNRFKIIIRLPPLRDRKDDISKLARLFFDKAPGKKSSMRFGNDVGKVLTDYDYNWPGNIRELQTVIETAVRNKKMTPINKSLTGADVISAIRLTAKSV